MASKLPSTLGERLVPRATRRVASLDPSAGLNLTRRGSAVIGAGYGDLAQGLEVAEKAAYEDHLRDEERNLKNLENEWGATRRKILFGDGTPDNQGFFATSGEDTLNARAGLEQQLNKARSTILGKAQGRVKQAFDLSSQASLQGDLEQADRYTIGQRKEANLRTSQASIEEAMQQASTYFSDDKKWGAAVDRIGFEMASMGDEQGWSQETINSETQKAISKAARQRIDRALITDAKSGELIYSKTKDMIDGDQRIEIEQDIKSAKKAEEVEDRLRKAEARQAISDADDAAFGQYASAILSGNPVSAKDIAMDKRLSGRSMFALANALEQKADRAKAVKTDPGLFNNLFQRIHYPDGTPDKINDWHDLVQYQPQMEFSDWNILRGEVEKQHTEEGKQQAELLQSVDDYAKRTLTGTNDVLGYRDPKGEELLLRARVEFNKAWDEGIKKGISPYELADENSPNFVGKVVRNLQRPMAEMMQDIFNSTSSLDLSPDEATPQPVTGAAANKPVSELPVVHNDAEYEALPPGPFVDKDGNKFVKPNK